MQAAEAAEAAAAGDEEEQDTLLSDAELEAIMDADQVIRARLEAELSTLEKLVREKREELASFGGRPTPRARHRFAQHQYERQKRQKLESLMHEVDVMRGRLGIHEPLVLAFPQRAAVPKDAPDRARLQRRARTQHESDRLRFLEEEKTRLQALLLSLARTTNP